MNAQEYFDNHSLWDLDTLKSKCEADCVYVITSKRFPNIYMFHYRDECQYENKWTDFSRMCRGLIVDLKSKRVLAEPFLKFFNVGQVPETHYDIIKEFGSFVTTEKLDGSMILVIRDPNTGTFHAHTKGSLDSDHGIYATALLPNLSSLEPLVDQYTLIFELIAKQFQIVVDYSKKGYQEGLYLIGARERSTGRLLPYHELAELAKRLNCPLAKQYEFESLDQLIETSKSLPVLEEGYVIRFQNDLMVKVKGTKYLEAHRFISSLSDKGILEALGENRFDELMGICPEEYRDDVQATANKFKLEADMICAEIDDWFRGAPKATRKEFALYVTQYVLQDLRCFLFTRMDNKQIDLKKLYNVVGVRLNVTGDTKI